MNYCKSPYSIEDNNIHIWTINSLQVSWASLASTRICTTGWVSICALSSVPSLHPYSLTFINFHPNVLLSSRWNVYDTTEVHPATSLSTRQPPVFNYLSIIHTHILERELPPTDLWWFKGQMEMNKGQEDVLAFRNKHISTNTHTCFVLGVCLSILGKLQVLGG